MEDLEPYRPNLKKARKRSEKASAQIAEERKPLDMKDMHSSKRPKAKADHRTSMLRAAVTRVLGQIKPRMELAEELGKFETEIYHFGPEEYASPNGHRILHAVCLPEWLTGTASVIFDSCKRMELAPSIRSWSDGPDKAHGFMIVVHW